MGRSHVSSIAVGAIAGLAGLAGCDGCHASKPYTPYTLSDPPPASASASASPAPAPSDAGPGDAGDGFAAVPATRAPGDGTGWPLEGGVAQPPSGHVFTQGLVVDVDGDGKPDLLAWARTPDGLGGELWFAPGKAPSEGRLVSSLPSDASQPGCTPVATLSQVGPRTALFDFDPDCPAHPRRPNDSRWVAVVPFGPAGPSIGLELRIKGPDGGEALRVGVGARDRDGDGRADLAVTLTLSGAPSPVPGDGSASVTLAYFDRPAGLSRDPTEPEASWKALAASLMAEGRKKTTSPRVPAASLAARRLHTMLCDEPDAITTSAGPVHCGDVRLFEDATMAEVEAALNLGDPVAAFAALGHLDAIGVHRKDVDGLVAKSVPSLPERLVRTTAAEPLQPQGAGWGSVAFDAGGDVLVRTRDRVVRVDHASFEESPVDPAPAWPTELRWSGTGGPPWSLGAIDTGCAWDTTFSARFGVDDEAPHVMTMPLPIAVSVPIPCEEQTLHTVVHLGTSAQGYLVAARGEVLALSADATRKAVVAESFALAPGVTTPPGAARSPDGGTIALPMSRGVLVVALKGTGRGGSAKLWTMPATDGGSSCVPANGGERLACAVRKGVAIYDAK